MKSADWLMVLLIIELDVTPHSDHLRKDMPDIQNAYLPIVRDLVIKNSLVAIVASRLRNVVELLGSESTNL